MSLASLILAAGHGKRIQSIGEKPFLQYQNTSFIEIAYRKCRSLQLSPIIIITNNTYYKKLNDLFEDVKIVLNTQPELGMISSIHCGLRELDHISVSGFLLLPIDFPLVKLTTYQALAAAHRKKTDFVLIPQYGNRRGHPVIFPHRFFEELADVPLDIGARWVIQNNPGNVFAVDVDDEGILININTPELYNKYCTG